MTEVEIENNANRLPIETVVARLAGLAGVTVTGIIGGVKNERAVRDWVANDRRPEREPQLRFAYRIASMIALVAVPVWCNRGSRAPTRRLAIVRLHSCCATIFRRKRSCGS